MRGGAGNGLSYKPTGSIGCKGAEKRRPRFFRRETSDGQRKLFTYKQKARETLASSPVSAPPRPPLGPTWPRLGPACGTVGRLWLQTRSVGWPLRISRARPSTTCGGPPPLNGRSKPAQPKRPKGPQGRPAARRCPERSGGTAPRRRARRRPPQKSMPEMPHSGEHHRKARFVSSGDYLVVADRTARLDHGSCARFGGGNQPVGKGEKGV